MVAFSGSEVLAQAQGGFPDTRMQDFQRRRDCEKNLPTCLPQVRRQIEQERTNGIWLASMIAGVFFLVYLMLARAKRQKQVEQQQLLAKGRQAARRRKEQRRTNDQEGDADENGDDMPSRSTLERPPGFGQH